MGLMHIRLNQKEEQIQQQNAKIQEKDAYIKAVETKNKDLQKAFREQGDQLQNARNEKETFEKVADSLQTQLEDERAKNNELQDQIAKSNDRNENCLGKLQASEHALQQFLVVAKDLEEKRRLEESHSAASVVENEEGKGVKRERDSNLDEPPAKQARTKTQTSPSSAAATTTAPLAIGMEMSPAAQEVGAVGTAVEGGVGVGSSAGASVEDDAGNAIDGVGSQPTAQPPAETSITGGSDDAGTSVTPEGKAEVVDLSQ